MEYYGNNDWRDYHLAHYGRKGMKKGKHLPGTDWWKALTSESTTKQSQRHMQEANATFETDRNAPVTRTFQNGKVQRVDAGSREKALRSAEVKYRAASEKFNQTKKGKKKQKSENRKRAIASFLRKFRKEKATSHGYKPKKPVSTPSSKPGRSSREQQYRSFH